MGLDAVLLILAAVAAAEAYAALRRPEHGLELSVMAAIVLIAGALILLDLSSATVAVPPPLG